MSENVCIVGLDIGTTSLKAVVYAMDGEEMASASVRVETTYDGEGAATQDPEAIYQGVLDVLRRATNGAAATAPDDGFKIRAIGFSSAMHSLIPVDDQGTALFPAMTWLDARPHKEAQTLWQNERGRDIYAHTGTPVHAMAPLSKLVWLRANRPNIFRQAARFVSIKEYVWRKWFGKWEVDDAIASATGLFNVHTFEWYDDAIDYADIRPDQLSKPVATTFSRRAEEAADLRASGIPDEAMVCIGGSDGVLSNLAAGALDASTLVLTVGTSLALRTGATKPAVDVETRSFCYILDHTHFVVGGPSNSGGVVLDWLYRNVMTDESVHSQSANEDGFAMLCEAAGEVDAEGLYFVPYINGERAPIWDEQASGTFFGLKSYQGQTHLMRAAMEGILFNAYWIAEGLFRQVGRPNRIIVSGKLFRNAWVRSFVADLFGAEIISEDSVDGATYGAAMLAATAADLSFHSVQRQKDAPTDSVTAPNPERHRVLLERYHRYRKISEALQSI